MKVTCRLTVPDTKVVSAKNFLILRAKIYNDTPDRGGNPHFLEGR